MGIFRKFFSKSGVAGEEVKVPRKTSEITVPPYISSSPGAAIADTSTNITNLVLSDAIRWSPTMSETIKKLVLSSPDLSHAVEAKIKSAISSRYTAFAYDRSGRVDIPATELVQGFLIRLNFAVSDYKKFSKPQDIRSLTASFLYDNFRYGAGMLEVVLGKTRLPSHIKVVPSRLLKWKGDGKSLYPVYSGPGNTEILLNYPNIIYSSSIQDGESPYAESPLQAAIQACLWDADFVNDLRRAAVKNLFQRLVVIIDSEKFLKSLPLDVQNDEKKLKQHKQALLSALDEKLHNVSPEEALTSFDNIKFDTISSANRSEDRTISVLQELINGKISAGAKILPSIIGRGTSSDAASTESLLFLKSISAAQLEFNNVMSRALTFILRTYGSRGYASFALEEVNLRPHLELASFRAIEQSSIYEQLSLGQISDVLACIKITGMLPPEGYKNLAGTMFKTQKPDVSGNHYSNTSVSADGKPDSTQSQKNTDPENKGVKSK
jgi:hypothetical protein